MATQIPHLAGRAKLVIPSLADPPLCWAVYKVVNHADIEICEDDGVRDPILELSPDLHICGDATIARYFARCDAHHICYSDTADTKPFISAEMDLYLSVFENYAATSDAEKIPLIRHLDSRLLSRTYVVGFRLSIADIALWILLRHLTPVSSEFPSFERWSNHVGSSRGLSELYLKK